MAWLAERINAVEPTWNFLGFLDDNPEMAGKTVDDYPVLGGCDKATDYPDAYFVCAIGSSRIRKNVIGKLGWYVREKSYADSPEKPQHSFHAKEIVEEMLDISSGRAETSAA
ncbi:MAG: hypothetical protein LUE92_11510 [Clostridiales bacterium]|nr:hypothetical protein [Clostridiales bacterium]